MKINIKMAGAVSHYTMFLTEINMLKKYQDIMDLAVYDGPNLCPWNGGRINRNITLTEKMVEFYNSNNIGVFLTFSNPVIDLTDPIGNTLLGMLNNNPLNGIMLTNEELRVYIKEKYPMYQLIFSITGHPNDISINPNLISYYKDLELKYDKIVPRFEMCLNPLFYNEVDTSKYELITNDTCSYGCSVFNDHFAETARINRISSEPWKELPYETCHKTEECWLKNFNPDIGSDEDRNTHKEMLGMDFNKEMFEMALNLGYSHFKITGRELTSKELKGDIFKQLNIIKSIENLNK